MKKTIIIAMALLLTVSFSAAAFAGQTIYFDNLKSVSYGTHGHYWSGDIDHKELLAEIQKNQRVKKVPYHRYGYSYSYYDVKINVYYHYDYVYNNGYGYYPWYLDYDQDGQWHFYKDAKGRLHYFYLDPDREYDWKRYKDENGVTQYYYDDRGWK